MLRLARGLTLAMAVALAAGETIVALAHGKYWPLSADDYAIAALLLYGRRATRGGGRRTWLVMPWALAAGNLYAMLFTRMDPAGGSGERLALVAVALAASLGGLAVAMLAAAERSSAECLADAPTSP